MGVAAEAIEGLVASASRAKVPPERIIGYLLSEIIHLPKCLKLENGLAITLAFEDDENPGVIGPIFPI